MDSAALQAIKAQAEAGLNDLPEEGKPGMVALRAWARALAAQKKITAANAPQMLAEMKQAFGEVVRFNGAAEQEDRERAYRLALARCAQVTRSLVKELADAAVSRNG